MVFGAATSDRNPIDVTMITRLLLLVPAATTKTQRFLRDLVFSRWAARPLAFGGYEKSRARRG